tara:strand:- start:517 stop:738 length:222 start_codon:yes stop_codon:yes gene_type:complete
MFEKGDWVKLKAKTRHGKNRINQHGNHWLVLNVDKFKGQPALSLRSQKQTDKGHFDGRWVLIKDDDNFEMEKL